MVGATLRHHDPAARLQERIEAGGARERALPPAVDVAVDQARVAGPQPIEVEVQVLGHLAGHVLDQRVGVVHEGRERIAPGRVLEVEAHLVLVAVQGREGSRGDGAEFLAAGRIDLHHARAEILQHEAPERPREELGGVDDEHAVEREHRRAPVTRVRSLRPHE